MFFGEFIVIFMYGLKKWRSTETTTDQNKESNQINPLLLAIPSLFDIMATTTMFIALTTVAASVFQMM